MATKRKPDKRVIGAALVVHGLVASLTWRDLRRRPASRVRGGKTLWRVLSGANTLGSVGYWLVGRR